MTRASYVFDPVSKTLIDKRDYRGPTDVTTGVAFVGDLPASCPPSTASSTAAGLGCASTTDDTMSSPTPT